MKVSHFSQFCAFLAGTDSSSDLFLPVFFSSSQLHNEDDSSEASTSRPAAMHFCRGAGSVRPARTQSTAQASSSAAEASESRTEGDAEAPPPPYASIELGATAAVPGLPLIVSLNAEM